MIEMMEAEHEARTERLRREHRVSMELAEAQMEAARAAQRASIEAAQAHQAMAAYWNERLAWERRHPGRDVWRPYQE
jgi:hypothetical protein